MTNPIFLSAGFRGSLRAALAACVLGLSAMVASAPASAADKPAAPVITGAPAARAATVKIEFAIRYIEGATLTCTWTGYHRNQGSSTGSCSSIATYAGGIYGSFTAGSTVDGYTNSTFSANNLTAAGDSSYTVSVTQTVGGVQSDPATFSTTLDVIPPNRPTVSPATTWVGYPASARVTSSKSETFTFSALANSSWSGDDNPSSYQCNVDSAGWTACTSPVSLSSLADGAHTFLVRALDVLGNTSPNSSSMTWTVDTAAPSAPSLTSPTQSNFASLADVPFAATAEGGASLLCSIDGGAYVACPTAAGGPGDRSVITVGCNTILHYGQGSGPTTTAIGMLPSGSPSWLTTASLNNPSIASIALGFGGNSCSAFRSLLLGQSGYAGLVLGVSQSVYNIFLIDLANTDVATPSSAPVAAFKGLADGVHTLRVKAADAAGNLSPATTPVSWRLGTSAPAAPRLSGAPGSLTSSTGASVGFTGEADASFTCSVDGGSYEACGSSPKVLNSLTDGDHSLSVKQTDQVGNTSTAASVAWTVDATAPIAPVLSGVPDALTRSKAGRITFTGEEGASFKCSQNEGPFVPCSSPLDWGGDVAGEHIPFRLTVTATDAAGNESQAVSSSWTVDTAAPLAPVIQTTSVASGVVRPVLTFTLAEQGGAAECRLSSGAWAACSGAFVPDADLATGDYVFEVRQTDDAGNVGNAASFNFHVTATVIAPAPPFVAVSYPVAPSWYMVGGTGHWQIRVPVSTGGDRRGAAQPMTVQISTVARPDSRLPSRASNNWKVRSYSPSFTWNHNFRMRPLWIRVGTKGGKWTPWTRLVQRLTP